MREWSLEQCFAGLKLIRLNHHINAPWVWSIRYFDKHSHKTGTSPSMSPLSGWSYCRQSNYDICYTSLGHCMLWMVSSLTCLAYTAINMVSMQIKTILLCYYLIFRSKTMHVLVALGFSYQAYFIHFFLLLPFPTFSQSFSPSLSPSLPIPISLFPPYKADKLQSLSLYLNCNALHRARASQSQYTQQWIIITKLGS